MKIYNRKYNFKSLESLINIASATKQTCTNDITLSTKNKSISQGKTSKHIRKQSSGYSVKSYKSHMSSSIDSLFNTSFEKNEKTFETQLKNIKKANTFSLGFFQSKTGAKANLNARVKTLSTFINLNRIESTNMSLLTKGEVKEKAILTFKSNRIRDDVYYLKNKVPFIKEEVSQMQNEIEEKKKETIALNNEILLLQKDLMSVNDYIKKYNKLNRDQLVSKDNIQTTLGLLRKHNNRLKENIKIQKAKTEELVHSASVLSKAMRLHIKTVVSPKRVMTKILY